MIKVGVTGSNGFIGWHLCRTLELDTDKFELIEFKRDWFNENVNLDSFASKCDIIIHLAGLNRHSEESAIYETLVNREDMIKAEDLGEYYRIPADNRDLNYEQYFSEGMPEITNFNEYHSHNTAILDVEGMKKLLFKLPIIRKDILGEVDAIQYPY